jgi:hypothetical protein
MAAVQSPPGWYADPEDRTRLRWWSGTEWGEQGPPAASAWVPPAVAQRPRKPVWPWILGGVGVLFVILVVIAVLAAVFVPRYARRYAAPISAANAYLRDQRAERLPEAYARLCSRIQDSMGYEEYVSQFRTRAEERGRILTFDASSSDVAFDKEPRAIDVDLTTTRGPDTIRARMVYEGGRWRWCGSHGTEDSTGIYPNIP